MSTERFLEGKLRPSYEYRTIVYSILVITLMWVYAEWLGLSLLWRAVFTTASLAATYPRIKSLIDIKRYQRSLNVIEAFRIRTDKIPWTNEQEWIGRGFEYTSVHAQRKWDAEKTNLTKYYELPKWVKWARLNEKKASVTIRKLEEAPKSVSVSERIKLIIAKITRARKWSVLKIGFNNPYPPLPPVGGSAIIHGVGFFDETDQYISQDDRTGHTIVIGQSRVGKTRLLEVQVSQDIARKDGVVGVFDPKTDLPLLGLMWAECKRNNREEDFYCFLLNEPEISAKYNGVASFARLTAIAGRIANQMNAGGDGQVFRDFAFNFMVMVSAALIDMGERPNFANMKKHIEDLEGLFNRYGHWLMEKHNPNYEEELSILKKPKFKKNAKGELVEDKMKVGAFKGRTQETLITDKLTTDFYERNPRLINTNLEGLRNTMKNDGQYVSKLTASLIPLLTKLTTGKIAEIITPDYKDLTDKRVTFSWDKIIQRKAVFYCGFSAMQDELVAQAVGNQFFSDLVAKAGEINAYGVNKGMPGAKSADITPIWLHCDEFQSLMGEEFIPLLNRSGSAGVKVTAYTQTLSDIEAKLGEQAKANVVLGNFNNVIMLRVVDEKTAEYFTQKIATCDLWGLDVSGATSDGGAITPKSTMNMDDEIGKPSGDGMFGTRKQIAVKIEINQKIITPDAILNLPKGQAFCFINGKTLLKVRFPMLDYVEGYEPLDIEEFVFEMKERMDKAV